MEMQSSPPAASVEAPSIWQTMIGVFTGPTQAFEGYKKRPTILVVLLVTMVLAYGMTVGVAEYNAKMQYEMLKTSEIIPPAQLEQMRIEGENVNRWTNAIGAAIVVPIITLIAALLAMFFGRVIFGGTGGFKAVWGVAMLAGLIALFGGFLRIPLVLSKGTMLVSYGLAAFLPGKDFTSIFYSLCYYCDIFFVWDVIVGGIGYSAIFGISRGKGIFTAFISGFIMVLLLIGLTAIGISFAGVEITFF